MATWQFALTLIPSSAARSAGRESIQLSREQIDECRLHLSQPEQTALYDALSALMPERRGWTTAIRFWGDEKGDDIHVSLDADAVECVHIRLDGFRPSAARVAGICAIARRFDCVFATPEGAVVQPSSDAVMRMFLRSPAMRFARDPEAFLTNLARLDPERD